MGKLSAPANTLRIVLLSLFVYFISGCIKFDFSDLTPCVPMPAIVPPKTSSGLNTFGCKVNGKPWSYVPRIYFWPWEKALYCVYTDNWDALDLRAYRKYHSECDSSNQAIQFNFRHIKGEGSDERLVFNDYIFEDGFITKYINKDAGVYELDTLQPYKGTLYYKDLNRRIFSGTFYFTAIDRVRNDTVRITDGVFDITADPS